ncbi:CRISPR-associated protein, Cas6 family [Chitinophaga sp. YR573]|uniref:CRISPR-associated endoribonuclease Cas6 n=1 Tax=Chitinophaga sp. YR573 TaxID=1881040 RepID=UPI0008C8CDD0|nr:CRISPR-associated endoribonuclease Cas6 [Chitinophaga sp. YR573]SEW46250.1 CRISPR-associated protein, Cas6 family [Chitinophaga sp. YR573]
MRLYLKLKPSDNTPVSFNYQPKLTGAIHKWLGKNEWHDATSLYSFSWLNGGRKMGDNLFFEHGANLEISAYDTDFIKSIIRGIQKDPGVAFGLTVTDITIGESPSFSEREIMYVSSPVLVKRTVEDKEIHYTYDNDICASLLTETFKMKLRKAGLSDEQANVSFLKDYPGAKTRIIYYNNIGNRVNVCPVVIEGSPEQIAFAWNVGVGNSTGIGFGALK